MFGFQTQVRVRYSETDQMGYVYYGHYASYYEVARVEALRSLGIAYKDMEHSVLMPVIEYTAKYLKPALYDEVLQIQVSIPAMPKAKIVFHYAVYNEKGELINTAETVLVFVHKESRRPVRIPDYLEKVLQPFFSL
ncbi:MAG: thioesterase family protein [Chitinophagaceae bacterium]|nr:thioesterase family protein [Chitinophagaceae bacterium]